MAQLGRPRERMLPEDLKKPCDYTYDYDRTAYRAAYYKKHSKKLKAKANARYRAKAILKYL